MRFNLPHGARLGTLALLGMKPFSDTRRDPVTEAVEARASTSAPGRWQGRKRVRAGRGEGIGQQRTCQDIVSERARKAGRVTGVPVRHDCQLYDDARIPFRVATKKSSKHKNGRSKPSSSRNRDRQRMRREERVEGTPLPGKSGLQLPGSPSAHGQQLVVDAVPATPLE